MDRSTLSLILLVVSACNLDSQAHYQDFLDKVNATSTGGGEDDLDAVSTGAEPFNTVTSASPGDPPGDDAQPNSDNRPQILSFSATPDSLAEAGPVTISIEHTPDVARVLLFDDYGGETKLLAELEPGTSTWEYPITSEADFDGEHELHAIALDDEERWDEAITTLAVDLHPAGSIVWVNDGKDDTSTFQGAIAVAADDAGVVVVVRDYNAGATSSFVRRHDGQSGDVVWEYAAPDGVVVHAIAQAPSGEMVIAGRAGSGEDKRMWTHQLDAGTGAPTWTEPEDWTAGTEAFAVTVAPDGSIYVVGSEIAQGSTSAYLWRLPADLEIEGYVSAKWAPAKVEPFAAATSVAVSESGRVFVGGYLAYQPDQIDPRDRMLVLEFDEVLDPIWIDAEDSFAVSRLLGLTSSDALAVVGWRKVNPDAKSTSSIRMLGPKNDAELEAKWTILGDEGEGAWVEAEVNERLIGVRSSTAGIEVDALSTEGGEIWSVAYEHGFANAFAGAGAVDRWGNTYFTGVLKSDGAWHTVVGKIRP